MEEIEQLPDTKKLLHDPYGHERSDNRHWAQSRIRQLIDEYIDNIASKTWREEGEVALFEHNFEK